MWSLPDAVRHLPSAQSIPRGAQELCEFSPWPQWSSMDSKGAYPLPPRPLAQAARGTNPPPADLPAVSSEATETPTTQPDRNGGPLTSGAPRRRRGEREVSASDTGRPPASAAGSSIAPVTRFGHTWHSAITAESRVCADGSARGPSISCLEEEVT